MKVNCLMALVFAATCSFAATDPFAEGVRPTDPLPPEQQLKTFKLPPGFSIQLVAAEPELRKPMNMAFDGAGRLWITESREYPWPTNTAPRDTIRILSDFDANGRARKVTTFATNLNIPIGVYPFMSPASENPSGTNLTWKCIAWSIPNIWLFEDTNNDGVADKKVKLLGPFDYTRDTHGNQASFRRGLDGWLYATHGFNNRSRVAGKDGHEISMSSGNTYRFRLDGSRVEHWSHGQVNPFGLTFDAMGNLYSADCHSSPIYQLLRGGWYPSFGAPDDGLGFAPLTIQHSHGSTAICGITMLDDQAWPDEFQNQLIIGNVMTSRINRDRIEWRGSTSVGHEMPDLVTVSDPWFRPVDLQLGPDGALWVADFYNRIIGHYEVPLPHPGRDRERGRIWRIVPPAGADLAKLTLNTSPPMLIADLASQNRSRRVLAMNALTDRHGKSVVPLLRRTIERPGNAHQYVHTLWLLRRFGSLTPSDLTKAGEWPATMVRVHAQRIAAEILHPHGAPSPADPNHIEAARHVARAGVADRDALVQRCAAEALARDQAVSAGNVRLLVDLYARVPAADNHLLYSVRAAMRDQLQHAKLFDLVLAEKWNEAQSRTLAGVCSAVTNAGAASFLVTHLQKYAEPRSASARYLRHAARFLPEDQIDELASLARDKFRDDVDLQATLFKSVQDGLQQRGVALSSRMQLWGSAVADDLLSSVRRVNADWVHVPGETGSGSNPWVVQRRKSADGNEAEFLSSLPSSEQATGVLRSKEFSAPARLTFWIAGHDGFPNKPLQNKNFVALRDANSFDLLKSALAPRHDTAQSVTWDLTGQAGKAVFLELVDGDTANAYAWLAVGRFEPAVVTMPKVTPKLIDERLQAAAQIVLATRDSALEPELAAALKMPSGADARASLATTLLALNSKAHLPACAEILRDGSAPAPLREKIAQAIADSNSADGRELLVAVLRGAPERQAPKLALALAGSRAGAEAVLAIAEKGQLSARVLQDRAVKARLVASKAKDADARIAALTKNLTPLNEELQKQIERRRAAFIPSSASAERGIAIFEKTCAACHQVDKKGALVGPQLDGIGSRGLERIIEDIVDPNRNVDHAFQTTTFVLSDGDIVSGLLRREEGETIVYAEPTGKESTVPKKSVKERHTSELSLMPEGLADALSVQEFNDLVAFLLSKSVTKN